MLPATSAHIKLAAGFLEEFAHLFHAFQGRRLAGFGDFGAGRFPPAGMWHGRGAPVCVPISVRGLLQSRALGTAVPLPPDYAMPPPPPGCYPLVDAKHHVVEVFDVISFPAADDHLLVLCTVDAYGVLSLDLPGGKRRLARPVLEDTELLVSSRAREVLCYGLGLMVLFLVVLLDA